MRSVFVIALLVSLAGHAGQRVRLAQTNDRSYGCDVYVCSEASKWAIVWESDSAKVSAKVSRESFVDDISGCMVRVSIDRETDGKSETLAEQQFTVGNKSLSMRLLCDSYSSRLFVDSDNEIDIYPCFRPGNKGEIYYSSGDKRLPKKMWAGTDEYPAARKSRFADKEQLLRYLESSTDPTEGIWRYLDRDLSGDGVRLGGRYLVAIARGREAESYEIIYLGGGEDHYSLWNELDIKGMMYATNFTGIYVVEWLDSTRNSHSKDEEVNGRLDGGVLKINFPLTESSIRLGIEARKHYRELLR